MKIKLLAALAALILLPACGSIGQLSEEEKAQVSQKIDARSFAIEVNYMNPQRGPGKALTDLYSVRIDGNTLKSHLPYVGNATNIAYGGGPGLNFEEKMTSYKDGGWKKGKRSISVSVSTVDDSYVYDITVYDGGSADIFISCRNRDSISFTGSVRLEND